MSPKPSYASGWYGVVPTQQLRQEIQRLYQLLSDSNSLTVVRHGNNPSLPRPDAEVVYWIGDALPTEGHAADLLFLPTNGGLLVFDGTDWN